MKGASQPPAHGSIAHSHGLLAPRLFESKYIHTDSVMRYNRPAPARRSRTSTSVNGSILPRAVKSAPSVLPSAIRNSLSVDIRDDGTCLPTRPTLTDRVWMFVFLSRKSVKSTFGEGVVVIFSRLTGVILHCADAPFTVVRSACGGYRDIQRRECR